MRADKSLGQNFLIDETVIEAIAKAAVRSPLDAAVEIGPGRGALTAELCELAKKVTAVELDPRLIPILKASLFNFDNLEIIEADILKTDINALFADHSGPRRIVGNLPYYITTPILMKLIEDRVLFDSCVVMVQKEVAEKITAAPSKGSYGVLAVNLQHFFDIETVIDAPSDCFSPRPKVDSRVIILYPRKDADLSRSKDYITLVKAAFTGRRKTLPNSLCGWRGAEKSAIAGALLSMGYPETARAENLSPEDFNTLLGLLSPEEK